MTDILAQIRATPWLAELLARFEFDLTRDDPVEQVHLASGEALTPIAGDGAGGTFLLTLSGAVVYAGSEGEGGLIAFDLRDALALVVGLPSLHDALARPLGDELRGWLAKIDEGTRRDDAFRGPDWLGLDEARARLREALGLPLADGLLAGLHAAAADDAYRPISEDGPYEPMLRS
ncbi:hypothetical protein [Acrocarpospora macrocephala]|nr:hypothetical protein [Acrocarpospora macrocephala]